MPGLFRRWEFNQVIEAGEDFRIEEAGSSSDGATLFAIYRSISNAPAGEKTEGSTTTGKTLHQVPSELPVVTEIQLCSWLSQAAPGDIFEYHRGFLALDLTPLGNPMSPESRAELARTGARAYALAERGFVHLVQRRIGVGGFSYLAVARPRSGRTPIPFETLMSEEAT